MIDSILIQNGRAHQIWRGTRRADLPPMTPELFDWVAEVPADTVNEGDDWDGANFSPPPAPVPADISRRQFYQQLALAGIITQSDALAAVKTGTIPAPLQAIIDAMPDAGDRFALEMLLAGAATIARSHPFTAAVTAARGMSDGEVDSFFRAAAQL